SLVAALRAEHRPPRNLALVGLRSAHDLPGQSARLDVLHVRDDAAVAARDDVHPPVRLHLRDRALPDRTRSLLDDHEPLDGRAGADHAAADSQDADSDSAETHVTDTADRRGSGAGRRRQARRREARSTCAASTCEAKEKEEAGPTVSELQVEATGETVG